MSNKFTFFLRVTFGHKASLILLNSTTRRKLLFEHPFATHRFATIGSFSELHVPLDRIESISLWIVSFQSSTSGDACASAIVVGVSSIRYTVKSSPKDFATLCLLLLRGASLSSFSRIFSCSTDCSEDSTKVWSNWFRNYLRRKI